MNIFRLVSLAKQGDYFLKLSYAKKADAVAKSECSERGGEKSAGASGVEDRNGLLKAVRSYRCIGGIQRLVLNMSMPMEKDIGARLCGVLNGVLKSGFDTEAVTVHHHNFDISDRQDPLVGSAVVKCVTVAADAENRGVAGITALDICNAVTEVKDIVGGCGLAAYSLADAVSAAVCIGEDQYVNLFHFSNQASTGSFVSVSDIFGARISSQPRGSLKRSAPGATDIDISSSSSISPSIQTLWNPLNFMSRR